MNTYKNYLVQAKGSKEEVLTALRRVIEYIENHVKTETRTIRATVCTWKEDTKGDMMVDIKVL